MPISDNRDQGGGGGSVNTVNGVAPVAGNVTLTPASIGAADAGDVTPVNQGSAAAPLAITNVTVVALDPDFDETLFLSGNGGNQNIDMANFTGLKPVNKKLRIIVKGSFSLTLIPGGNFNFDGNRHLVAGSAINFVSDGPSYLEDGNEIVA